MPLPVTFASLSLVTLTQLDLNFNALGQLTPIPCLVTGSNLLTLAPLANTPTVTALHNYMQFTGIVAAANTGSVSAAVAGLPPIPVYKDSATGPVPLTGGELITGIALLLMFDQSLNAGGGGFHMGSEAPVLTNFLALAGGTLSGAISGPNATFAQISGSTITVPAANISTVSIADLVMTPVGSTPITSFGFQTVTVPPGTIMPGTTLVGSVSLAGLTHAYAAVGSPQTALPANTGFNCFADTTGVSVNLYSRGNATVTVASAIVFNVFMVL